MSGAGFSSIKSVTDHELSRKKLTVDGLNEREIVYSGGMDDGKRTMRERRNPRGLKGDTSSEDDDDSSDDEEKGFVDHTQLDVQMENEFGYGLITSIRGRTTGRRTKRELCCFTTMQIVCGIALYTIYWYESKSKFTMDFFIRIDSDVLGWTRSIAIMCFLWGTTNLLLLRYWASLVTNRVLLSTVLKLMVLVFFIKFILVLVALVKVINTFSEYRYGAGASPDVNAMFPFYLCSVIFLFAYLVGTCCYGMSISYMNEEVEMGGSIKEPDPVGSIDLGGVTFKECCTVILAYPVAVVYQAAELVYAIYLMGSRGWYFFWRRFEESRQASAVARAAAAAARNKKGRSLYRRLTKTLKRLLSRLPGFGRKHDIDPYVAPVPQNLDNVHTGDREQAERLEQERKAEEARRRAEFEKMRRQKEGEAEEARLKAEAEAAEAARRLKELEEEEARIAANQLEATLNSDKFKKQWGDLQQAGSFQCKLKMMPDLKAFTAHLVKQGFHVVFAAGPSAAGDIEIGLCNIRSSNEEKWFLARLLAAKGAFSAIMKAEAPDIVPKFVKKFALAKILKIDTNKK
eukprot:GSChrysophyteH1.ASY1.ANO1.2687.1 assembled CDS